ncbi:MAG: AraC family transcriptional regulator [Bacteroidetes bacterium]|nr:AraC family transcriptional regulator [Bacteroidota bacterium]
MINQRFISQKSTPTIELLFCGDEKCSPAHEFGGLRTHILVHVVVSGKGKFYWERKSWELTSGDAFVIFPDEKHLYRADTDDPWHYFWIAMNRSLIPYLLQNGVSQEKPILSTENAAELYRFYRSLYTGTENGRVIQELDRYAIVYRIMANLLKHHVSRIPLPGSLIKTDHTQTMLSFINSYYQTSISVENVAAYVHLERTYASRLFKNKTGWGIAGYIRNKRLEKSKEHLMKGISAKQAAYSVGFQVYENYLKAFKRRYGETPGEFRSRLYL